MAKTQITMAELGGGTEAKWLTDTDVTISGTTLSCSWNYDAETVLILALAQGHTFIVMFDMNRYMWYANESDGWQSNGQQTATAVNITPRSLAYNLGLTISYASVIPLTNKPTGYFS